MCNHKWKTIEKIGNDRIQECKVCGAKKRIVISNIRRILGKKVF